MKNRGEKHGNNSRRAALKKMMVGAGAVVSLPIVGPGAGPLSAAPTIADPTKAGARDPIHDPNWKPEFLDSHQNSMVEVLTELIIPATDSPGAKAARVNRFIDLWMNDEEAHEQREFLEGLSWLDGRSLQLYRKPFTELTAEQQTQILTPLAKADNKNPDDAIGVRFFQDLKDMTIFGYYTSQIGLEQDLHYVGDEYHNSFPGACTHSQHQS
jgi:hypothetical protein